MMTTVFRARELPWTVRSLALRSRRSVDHRSSFIYASDLSLGNPCMRHWRPRCSCKTIKYMEPRRHGRVVPWYHYATLTIRSLPPLVLSVLALSFS